MPYLTEERERKEGALKAIKMCSRCTESLEKYKSRKNTLPVALVLSIVLSAGLGTQEKREAN